MPVAENQDMFENETCYCHKLPGVLVLTHRNTYRWRCKFGGMSWTTEGSQMDIYNEIVDPFIDE